MIEIRHDQQCQICWYAHWELVDVQGGLMAAKYISHNCRWCLPAMLVLSVRVRVQVPDAASGKPVTAAQRVLRGAAEAAQLPPAVIVTPQCAALATLAGV